MHPLPKRSCLTVRARFTITLHLGNFQPAETGEFSTGTDSQRDVHDDLTLIRPISAEILNHFVFWETALKLNERRKRSCNCRFVQWIFLPGATSKGPITLPTSCQTYRTG